MSDNDYFEDFDNQPEISEYFCSEYEDDDIYNDIYSYDHEELDCIINVVKDIKKFATNQGLPLFENLNLDNFLSYINKE